MRRTCLLTIIVAVVAWGQTSSGPTSAQTPITVKIEMPPANPWDLAKTALPVLLGAVATLIGVWITSRNNRKNLAATQKHDEERAYREGQSEMKKTMYFDIVRAADLFKENLLRYHGLLASIRDNTAASPDSIDYTSKSVEESKLKLTSAISVARLFLSGENFATLAELSDAALTLMVSDPKVGTEIFDRQLAKVVQLAKDDLWALEPKGK